MNIKPDTPSGNGGGRDRRGRFGPGNPGGPGKPPSPDVLALRRAFRSAVSVADVVACAKALVKAARGGDMDAIRELLDRVLGRPGSAAFTEEIERLISEVEELKGSRNGEKAA